MLIYNLVVSLYGCVIHLAALKKEKAKQWVNGRKRWREFYSEKLEPFKSKQKIWIHCASYGEFEQGRPLIEAIRKKYPDKIIVLTFFSPSGFEAFKSWPGADVIGYLPLDSGTNSKDFLEIVKPETAIFIKYEFWLHYLKQLREAGIRTYLVSAVFKPHHPFFKPYGGIFRKSLSAFNKLFIQDEASGKLLESIGIKNYEVSGDTRYDRVTEIANSFQGNDEITKFKGSSMLIIAGSTWPKDEELLMSVYGNFKKRNCKLIIAPHEIDESHIANIETAVSNSGFTYSLFTEGINYSADILIVNTIGMLSRIYFHADVAYIGGGFNSGIHNTLEPAAFGVPVVFYGDDKDRFNEVTELKKYRFAQQVNNQAELSNVMNNYLFNESKTELKEKIRDFVKARSKTTERILESI